MKKAHKYILISIIIFTVILFIWIRIYMISSAKFYCSQIAQNLCEGQGMLQDYITYSMFSDNIKSIISEEEYYSNSSDVALKMYCKLEGTQFVDKENFPGSTNHWKSDPVPIFITFENKKYAISYDIDLDVNIWKVIPKVEVVNFKCYICEIKQ